MNKVNEWKQFFIFVLLRIFRRVFHKRLIKS